MKNIHNRLKIIIRSIFRLFFIKINYFMWLFFLSISLILIFSLNYISQDSLINITNNLSKKTGFVVKEIKLSGRQNTDLNNIINLLGIKRNDPIATLDISKAKQRLESNGWIKSVVIRRNLPSVIEVNLLERKPYALWKYDNTISLITKNGVIITNTPVNTFSNYFMVIGKNANLYIDDLTNIIFNEPILSNMVLSATRVGDRRWNINLNNNIIVFLPEKNIKSAWRKLAQLQNNSFILEKKIQVIDLRIPNRITVKLKNNVRLKNYFVGEPT